MARATPTLSVGPPHVYVIICHIIINSLLTKIFKGKYFQNSLPFKAPRVSKPFFGWRSIIAAKDLVTKEIRRTIRTEEHTLIWDDTWIRDMITRPPIMPQVYDPNMKVCDLIDPVKKDWDTTKLKGFLDPHNIPLVRSLYLSRNLIHDGHC